MPKFLETKLKKEYGAKSDIPYKVMNSIGAMKGSKETPKGAAMERKHIEHVHQHLQTPKVAPDKGMDKRGEPHHGPVAGTMPAHDHLKVTHFYKKSFGGTITVKRPKRFTI
jgi:hypothetical protein